MRILVTGATGFVGNHCIDALCAMKNITLIAACRDPAGLPTGFMGETRIGDLRNDADVKALLQDIDVVIHAAAWTSLWGNKTKSKELYLDPSLNLIKAAQHHGVKRFVFISSISVAAPGSSQDANSHGSHRAYWPHESNVVRIENELRAQARDTFSVVDLRLGLFAGARYSLGLLPIIAPRLKTHLVPWVAGGRTGMPIVDGRDIGQAASLAATVNGLAPYTSFNIIGPEHPTVRDVLIHLHTKHNLPLPHFSVPFAGAFVFAWLMEKLDMFVPWEPLVTRSIIHLMQETNVDNTQATKHLGYAPKHHWKQAVDRQVAEMAIRQTKPMKMAKPT